MERGPGAARHRAQPLHPRRLPRPGDHQGRHRPGRADAEQRAVPPRDDGRRRARTTSTRTSPASTSCAPRNAEGSGEYYVLEDNLRVPSGVSYMLENRKMMMRLFPELFSAATASRRSRTTPTCCWRRCAPSAPAGGQRSDRGACSRPACTTAPTSSTPSWRSRWASSWSRGRTCSSKDNFVYMRTTRGPKRVDVIYRRVDDDFLDPLVFRPDSTLGCAGLLRRLPRRQRDALQRHRHRRGRRQVDLSVRAEDDRVLPRREADPEQRADLHVPRRRTT